MLFMAALLFAPALLLNCELAIFRSEGGYRAAFVDVSGTDQAVAASARLEIGEGDYISRVAEGSGYAVFDVGRAYTAYLSLYGERTEITVNASMSADDVLESRGVVLSENDRLNIPGGDAVATGETLSVDRVEQVTRYATETVAYSYVKIPTTLLKEGVTYHAESGENGSANCVYTDIYVNGKPSSSVLVSRETTEKAKDDITLVGTPGAAGSFLTGGEAFIPDGLTVENNVPSSYTKLIEGANCTAYTSSYVNAFGASGMGLFQGCVAVNPAVIPYGSLLYIASADGRYVYGYAIAADTGTAMLEGYTDIDCYFETYKESALFGRKYLNVYVIVQLTQSDLANYCSVTQTGAGMFKNRIPK